MSALFQPKDLEIFRTIISDYLGFQFDGEHLSSLHGVLDARMRATHSHRFEAYLHLLTSPVTSREELGALVQQVTVGETYFFRNPDHFRALLDVALRDILGRVPRRPKLRILSVGCATGEEPYTLAILMRDNHPQLDASSLSIRGIDINSASLEKARRGRYSDWSLRATPAQTRERYFRKERGDFVLLEALKDCVTFEEQNVVKDAASFWMKDTFDIVFFRNVTIYFSPEATRAVLARLAFALTPGGYLFMGHAESLRGISNDFHLLHTHQTFYYRKREASAAQPSTSLPAPVGGADRQRSAAKKATAVEATSAGPATSRADDADAALSAAQRLFDQERFGDAFDALRHVPRDPLAPQVELLRAAILTNRGDRADAQAICERLLASDDLNAGAHFLLALCHEQGIGQAAASAHYEMATHVDPSFAMPHLHRGLLAKRGVDLVTARRELGLALALLATDDDARIRMFGGGFKRQGLEQLCRAELAACGGPQ